MSDYRIYPKQFNIKQFEYNKCFVIMPFKQNMDKTFETIQKVFEEVNIKCYRADEFILSEPIINQIINSINTSRFIIVDISNLNPNVFYELGVAHSLKDVKNVLIIKNKKTNCPSDISHLRYNEYRDDDNYNGLKKILIHYIETNSIESNFKEIISNYGIIEDWKDKNEIINDLLNLFDDKILVLCNYFNHDFNTDNYYDILIIIKMIIEKISNCSKKGLAVALINLLVSIISKTDKYTSDIAAYLFDNHDITNLYKAKLSAKLLDCDPYFDIAFRWLKEYLSHSNPASVDTVRYEIELSLINGTNNKINEYVVMNLSDNNDTLVEHMANIVKERKINFAKNQLLHILKNHHSPYVVRSTLDALAEIGSPDEIKEGINYLKNRYEFIEENSFLKIHIGYAQLKL